MSLALYMALNTLVINTFIYLIENSDFLWFLTFLVVIHFEALYCEIDLVSQTLFYFNDWCLSECL